MEVLSMFRLVFRGVVMHHVHEGVKESARECRIV